MSSYADTVRFLGIVERRSEVSGLVSEAGDTVLVSRRYPRLIVMRCPCGCGDDLVVNLDPNAGPAWTLYVRKSDFKRMTIYPSVWRDSGCGSHFIVWHGQIIGIGRGRKKVELDPSLVAQVEDLLRLYPRHFYELATELGENPWSVLWACEELVSQGRADGSPEEGNFRKR